MRLEFINNGHGMAQEAANGWPAGRVRVLAAIGTRPEAIKMFSPLRALHERESEFETILCSSGQHCELLRDALATFGLRVDHDLAAMRHNQQPGDLAWSVAAWITDLCRRVRPDLLLVQGDTTTTMAAGLAGFYSSIPVAHVEAGLRTYDNAAPWPEEGNRRIVDAVADFHFAPTELAAANLLREGVGADRVHVTGNTGIDALHWARSRPRGIPSMPDGERRVVITTHRRESIPHGVEAIILAVRRLAHRYPDVRFQFVTHPAPAIQHAVRSGLNGDRPDNVEVLRPQGYVPFVQMLADSYLILTDSGGVQEEAPALGKPVLVVNHRTARQEPLAAGTARLVGTTEEDIVTAAVRLLEDPAHYEHMAARHDPYGDGQAGERIAAVLSGAADSLRRDEAAQGERAVV